MLLDRLRHLADRLVFHHAENEQHRAAVDLLVLTIYCNGTVSEAELDELDKFDVDHADWDDADFSVGQYIPVSMSKVRRGLDQSDQATLLAEYAGRVTDPALRAETISGCEAIATSSGDVDEAESAFLAQVRAALA